MQKLAFGTDGIRGRVGDFPFTPTDLQHFGSALGRWMVDRYGKNNKRIKVLLAGDTRESVDSIKKIISEQLVLFPIDVIDAGVTREQALTQVFSGKGRPRVSMMLLLPSKQPLPIVTSCDVHNPSLTLELPS